MIRYTPRQDIAKSDAQVIVNTVNCVGAMGKGVALAMKKAFPEIEAPYKKVCADGRLQPGTIQLYRLSGNRVIVNMATKDDWRDDSRLEWVGGGLVFLSTWLQRQAAKGEKAASVALPPPGCGNGGLDWPAVQAMVRVYLAPVAARGIDIRIFAEEAPAVDAERIYAGVGSRETPPAVLAKMTELGCALAEAGWRLRSGGAEGADTAFHMGARRVGVPSMIYVAKRRPDLGADAILDLRPIHERMARAFHPAPDRLSDYALKLMSRNGNQVFGPDFATPSTALFCWTVGGAGKGGTGQALRLSRTMGIASFDLGKPELGDLPVPALVDLAEVAFARRQCLLRGEGVTAPLEAPARSPEVQPSLF